MWRLILIFNSGNLLERQEVSSYGNGSMILRLVFSLALIIGLIYLSLYLLRKSPLGIKRRGSGELIQVIDRYYLSPKKGIFVVKIGSKILALGMTENQINLLSELNPDSGLESSSEGKIESKQGRTNSILDKIKDKFS